MPWGGVLQRPRTGFSRVVPIGFQLLSVRNIRQWYTHSSPQIFTQIPGTGLSLNHSTKAFSSSSTWCSSPPFLLNKPGTAAQHHASKLCALPVSLGISTCFFQPFPVGRASDALPELLCNTGIVEKWTKACSLKAPSLIPLVAWSKLGFVFALAGCSSQ